MFHFKVSSDEFGVACTTEEATTAFGPAATASDISVLELTTLLAFVVVASRRRRLLLLVMVTSCWNTAVFAQLHTNATTMANAEASAFAVALASNTTKL